MENQSLLLVCIIKDAVHKGMSLPYIAALEISEAKHADLIARMTAQLRELNSVKQDTQREAGELKKKLQVMKERGCAALRRDE